MNSKYLPIGSIVTLANINKKIMIVGYYSIEYQNVVKIYDYIGYVYPEGLLLKNTSYSFNHSDIVKIDFVGYQDDTYRILNNNLNDQRNEEINSVTPHGNFVNFQFDENGVVVYEEISKTKKSPSIVTSKEVANPFEVKETPAVTNTSAPKVNTTFAFDENGFVVADESTKENLKDIESNFQFDENGFVISDNSNKETTANNATYKFDANGYIVSDGMVNEESKIPQYQFTSDGIIVSE